MRPLKGETVSHIPGNIRLHSVLLRLISGSEVTEEENSQTSAAAGWKHGATPAVSAFEALQRQVAFQTR